MTPEEKNELLRKDDELKKLTAELTQRNSALQAEIIERKRVEKEMLEITQKEQRRFGSQLHDGLCQELTGILMFVNGLTQKMERNNRLDVAELNKISVLLNGAVSQARATARGLYPGELENVSLMNILEDLVVKTESLSKISCRFHCPKTVLVNNNSTASHLYKIAQEGVNNAVRHSHAQQIEVVLKKEGDSITLCIKDDGTGIKNDASGTKGIGLKIMKYRAHMMDAFFKIEDNIPRGTILTCTLRESP